MIVVYIKHYLSADGIKFFNTEWFSATKTAIKQQNGFISIDAENNSNDYSCILITLKFESSEKLTTWASTATHKALVDSLKPYQIKPSDVTRIEEN